MTSRKVAAGIWFVFGFVFGAVFVNDLLEGDGPGLVLGAALAPACVWIGYRILRRFTRDIAVVAATVSAALALFAIVGIVQGNLPPFPGGAIVLALIALAGVIPLRERRSFPRVC
jgi:hypothetical protein